MTHSVRSITVLWLLAATTTSTSAFLDQSRQLHFQKRTHPFTSQLQMAWSLPTPPRPSWYEDCGNPTVRQVVYDDADYDELDHQFESSFSNLYARDNAEAMTASSNTNNNVSHFLPRGARISRCARRAFQGLRDTLRP